jgi:hypothetical protein
MGEGGRDGSGCMVGDGMRPGGRAVGVVVALGLMLAAASPARGVVWSAQPTAVSGYMAGVSCVSARACIAVGEVGYKGPPGAMGWNGRRWSQESVPNPGPAPDSAATPESLTGVSCTSTAACIAVGSYNNAVGETLPMAVGWNGAGWSLLAAPILPSGATGGGAQSVSCLSRSACMAVGGTVNEAGVPQPFTDWWDGSAWSLEKLASPAESTVIAVESVSCTAGSACTAVGTYSARGLLRPLAERWNGSLWSVERMSEPAGATDAGLSRVSCTSPRDCVAVGGDTSSKAQHSSGTLIERWNGVDWSAQSLPVGLGLTSVSCTSRRACTAVGDPQSATGAESAVVERWNGSRWTLSRLPGGAGLSAVSCSSSLTCTALGTTGGRVIAYRSARASATLTGIPAGCVSAPFTVRVTGLGISSVTWRLGSRPITGHSIHSGTRYTARIRLPPGSHTLTVKVKFQPYTHARVRTFRRIVAACPAAH